MSCTIAEEFPLLPYEPTPRGETLAHWRNEINKVWKAAREEWCVEHEVDLTGINADIAAAAQALVDISGQLPPYPFTALGIFYATDANHQGKISIGTANQVLGVTAAGTGYEYKTIQGTASEIDVTHGVGTITIGLVDPVAISKGGTGQATATL